MFDIFSGKKLDGVICDGESNETVASTVVDCLNIDKGSVSHHIDV